MDAPAAKERSTEVEPRREAPRATIADTETISPRNLLRFVRSLVHPVLRPHRYFRDSLERPDDYLKPTQALALGFIAYWFFDDSLTRALAKHGLTLATMTPAQHQVMTVFRALLPLVTVWGIPFFVRFSAWVARLDMGWGESTHYSAFSVSFSVVGTGLQLGLGEVGMGVSLVVTIVAHAYGYVVLGRRGVGRAVLATAVLTVAELAVFSFLVAGYGYWLTALGPTG